jgi:large subunit ribosomal protein L13
MNKHFANPAWHLVDAKNKICGRLSTQIVTLLRGKHKPNFTPWYDCGDYVVVINAKDVHFSGDKFRQKKFTWHTGYPGGLKQRTVREQLNIKPEEVLRKSVLGMLAKNNLRYDIARKLRIFPGPKHFHEDKLPAGTQSVL